MPASLPPEDEIARLRVEEDQGASLRDRAGQQSPSPAVSAASAVTITSRKCPVCGETAPEPASLCIPRLIGVAKSGEPCDYSHEGEERFAAEVGGEKAAKLDAVMNDRQI